MRAHPPIRALVLLALAAAPAAPARAQNLARTLPADPAAGVTRVATRGLNFLELGVGARALALGGAYTALAEGLTALYWNVAGLADVPQISATFSYQELYENSGLSNTFFAVGLPIGAGAAGLSITRFSSGEIRRTTERYPDGYDPAFGTTVEWTGTALALHYARRITDRLSFGASAKRAQEGMDFVDASWVGVDLGVVFRTGLVASTIAVSVSNLGGRARMEGPAVDQQISAAVRDPLFNTQRSLPASFKTQALQMPTIFRFGIRTELLGAADAVLGPNPRHDVTLLTDLSDPVDGPISPALAVEYGFRDRVFLRGAKRWQREDRAPFRFADGLAIGGGIRLPALGRRLALDYAYQTLEPLGPSQTFSIELGF